jgi:hypothetical protein
MACGVTTDGSKKGEDNSMATYPDGTLLKASGPEVDMMEGGKRRWIPDPSTFNCMHLNWGAIQTIADSDWDQIPQGAPYPSRADGALLQGSGPYVYVVTGCVRHWIPDPATFEANGYNWSAIQKISDIDLNAIPWAPQLPSVLPPAVITIHNQGGYTARCLIQYVLSQDGQPPRQQGQGGDFSGGQTYSASIPADATNLHIHCEGNIGWFTKTWETIIDKTYPSAVQQSFTLTSTGGGLGPGFTQP